MEGVRWINGRRRGVLESVTVQDGRISGWGRGLQVKLQRVSRVRWVSMGLDGRPMLGAFLRGSSGASTRSIPPSYHPIHHHYCFFSRQT